MEVTNKGKPKKLEEVNAKQKIFCEEYAKHGNGTLAYKKAYPTTKKDDTARVNASKLLTNTNIKKYIEKLSNDIQNDRIASISEIQEFWTTTFRNIEEKTQDRLKASELLGKSKGMFLDKVEHSVDKTISFVINSVKRK